MKQFWGITRHFLLAAIVSVVSACLLHTQMVLLELSKIDIQISMQKRLYMSAQDLLGLAPTYGVIICLGLILAFSIAFALRKYLFNESNRSYYLYVVAGGAAMLTILLAMHPILELTLLAGARSSTGIILQILAGLMGGLCFANLRKQHAQKAKF